MRQKIESPICMQRGFRLGPTVDLPSRHYGESTDELTCALRSTMSQAPVARGKQTLPNSQSLKEPSRKIGLSGYNGMRDIPATESFSGVPITGAFWQVSGEDVK